MKYVITENHIITEGGSVIYGIAAEGGELCFDLGENREEAEKLVGLLNKEKIPEEHFRDILEDYLSDRDTFAVKYL